MTSSLLMTAVFAHAAAAASALVESKQFEKGPIVLKLLIQKKTFLCVEKKKLSNFINSFTKPYITSS